jgi:dTDP-4-dehydrorhamnose reductase
MKPKILLIGKLGQIGFDLEKQLALRENLVAVGRSELNLCDAAQIRDSIERLKPDIVINAAGYTSVDSAEREPARANAVNAVAPSVLAKQLKTTGGFLVHYSTDYVFDGRNTTPYLESDLPNPLNAYGRSMLEGEEAIRQTGVDHLILRTGWVYANRGRNFLLTILRLATQREESRIVNDQFGAPTSSSAVAAATVAALEKVFPLNSGSRSNIELAGTYHVTARGQTTWYEFARAIIDAAKKSNPRPEWLESATQGQPLKVRTILPISTADYPTPARRPAYSVLSNDQLKAKLGIELPHWKAQLDEIFTNRLRSRSDSELC